MVWRPAGWMLSRPDRRGRADWANEVAGAAGRMVAVDRLSGRIVARLVSPRRGRCGALGGVGAWLCAPWLRRFGSGGGPWVTGAAGWVGVDTGVASGLISLGC